MNVGGLFSGIGGGELGLERAGFDIAWHCESDPFCRRVLDLRWPDVPCFADVRGLRGRDVEPVDVLCGGFPCQDISVAGAGAGIEGSRSGLWGEFARLIGELRPRYVLVENVAALTARGLDTVLGDLAARGFDAEWDCLPASAFGAPHQRDRLWLVAYPGGGGVRVEPEWGQREGRSVRASVGGDAVAGHDGSQGAVAYAEGEPVGTGLRAGVAAGQRHGRSGDSGRTTIPWTVEPDVGRVAHGIPARVDRLRALGNALVPQIAEWIGRRILEWEAAS